MLSCCILLHAHVKHNYAYSLYLKIILTWLNEEALVLFIKTFISFILWVDIGITQQLNIIIGAVVFSEEVCRYKFEVN